MCRNFGMKEKVSTEYNPQSNSIVERVHQVVGNMIWTFEVEEREMPEENPFEPILTAVAYAIRSTYHTKLQAMPGQLVFGRDMLLPVQFKADWAAIALRKQKLINKNNEKENKKHKEREYRLGDKVLLERPGKLRKLSMPREGPYEVTEVGTNGTCKIRKGHAIQMVNIHRIMPFLE